MRLQKHRRACIAVVFLIVAAGGSAFAQIPPGNASAPASPVRDDSAPIILNGTSVIAGRVTHRGNENVPVKRAFISLMTSGVVRRQVVSDDDGHFWFGNLPAGRYTMRFNKVAYAGTLYGGKTARGEGITIVLAEGQRITDLYQTMVKSNVVTGRVLDESGVPIVGASVTVYERLTISGKPTFRQSGAGGAVTDDRGVYRFYGFEPGNFLVGVRFLPGQLDGATGRIATAEEIRWAEQRTQSPGSTSSAPAMPTPAKPVKYSRAYAPGVTDPNAATVLTFGLAEEKAGVDIVVPLVPTATVSGRVVAPAGMTLVRASLTVQSVLRDNPQTAQGRRLIVGPDGEFSIDGLEPGRYSLLAMGQDPSAAGGGPVFAGAGASWAMSEVAVSGEDIADLTLALQPTTPSKGRVVFDAAATPPDFARVSIGLRSAPDSPFQNVMVSGVVAADGSFTLPGLVPGVYVISAAVNGPASAAWAPTSVLSGARNVIDDVLEVKAAQSLPDLEVHFTDRKTDLSGTIVDQGGRPAPEYSIFVFTTDKAMWRQGSRWIRLPAKPTRDGRFAISGLPAGEYYVAALGRFDPLEWYTSEFMEQVTGAAIKITLKDGEKTIQELRVR
jgi:hypothetical protein